MEKSERQTDLEKLRDFFAGDTDADECLEMGQRMRKWTGQFERFHERIRQGTRPWFDFVLSAKGKSEAERKRRW